MTAIDFIGATHGTQIITGTDAVTGNFAGFQAIEETVIAAIEINEAAVDETYFGSATIAAGQLVTVSGYTNEILCTSITLTSGSLVAIKGL
jgi:hypothetical protein